MGASVCPRISVLPPPRSPRMQAHECCSAALPAPCRALQHKAEVGALIDELAAAGSAALGVSLDDGAQERLCAYARSGGKQQAGRLQRGLCEQVWLGLQIAEWRCVCLMMMHHHRSQGQLLHADCSLCAVTICGGFQSQVSRAGPGNINPITLASSTHLSAASPPCLQLRTSPPLSRSSPGATDGSTASPRRPRRLASQTHAPPTPLG